MQMRKINKWTHTHEALSVQYKSLYISLHNPSFNAGCFPKQYLLCILRTSACSERVLCVFCSVSLSEYPLCHGASSRDSRHSQFTQHSFCHLNQHGWADGTFSRMAHVSVLDLCWLQRAGTERSLLAHSLAQAGATYSVETALQSIGFSQSARKPLTQWSPKLCKSWAFQ